MSDEITPPPAPKPRRFSPYLPWLLYQSIFPAWAIGAAVADGSALWLLTALPAVPNVIVYAWRTRHRPKADMAECQRLDRILIEVGGYDAFLVHVQDQVETACAIRLVKQPKVIAASEFVRAASDGTLRSVAALQHATLRSEGFARCRRQARRWMFTSCFVCGLVLGMPIMQVAHATARTGFTAAAVLAAAITSANGWTSSLGVWASSRRRAFSAMYDELDDDAAELAGSPGALADALEQMRDWRETNRAAQPRVLRLALRATYLTAAVERVPERIARLRAIEHERAEAAARDRPVWRAASPLWYTEPANDLVVERGEAR